MRSGTEAGTGPDDAALETRIDPRVLAQLRAVPLEPRRPLLVVDADEVLVDFAGHLARFCEGAGITMRLTRYELEGSMTDRATGRVLAFDEAIGMINRFFAEETPRQQAVPEAAEALARLSRIAQIVVLTNVPRHATQARIDNLAQLGMAYPLVENGGGKGRALAWLAQRAGTPAAFVDDSPKQIESARRRAPHVTRLHFAGAAYVARLIPDCPAADHRVDGWAQAEAILGRLLG